MANGHGGVRPGAGRPSTGRRRVVLQLTEMEELSVRCYIAEMRHNPEDVRKFIEWESKQPFHKEMMSKMPDYKNEESPNEVPFK